MNGTWTTLEISGKRADVYEPAAPPRFGVLYLHDLDLVTMRDNPGFAHCFDEVRLACVCPHGGRCWWGDRPCPEFDAQTTPERYLLERILPFFKERWGLEARAIGLLGTGMGGQGVLRLAFRQPRIFPVVVGLSSALDYHDLYGDGSALDGMYDSKEQCRQDTALMHIHPNQYPAHIFFAVDPDDDWFRGNDRLHEKLNALGVAHAIDLTTRAGGHSWAYVNHMADRVARFLADGLEQESRRLL